MNPTFRTVTSTCKFLGPGERGAVVSLYECASLVFLTRGNIK